MEKSRCHLGKEGLKSGYVVTPGQASSSGVPRVLDESVQMLLWQRKKHIPEDLENLVNLGITREKGFSGTHLSKDGTDRPHVHASGVLSSTKQDLWSTIPKGDDLMGIASQRNAEGSSKTEISQLEISILVNQQVLGLQVTMQYTARVTVLDTLVKMQHELLDHLFVHSQVAYGSGSSGGKGLPTSSVSNRKGVHVLFEIQVEEFHDEVELVAVCVNNIKQTDYIWVVKLSQDGNLADGGAGDALVFGLETDLFEGDDATVVTEITGFVDDTIST